MYPELSTDRNPATIANFFWQGAALGPIELGCISSFVTSGFEVRVFSYQNLDVPDGSSLLDARTILPESQLTLYCQAGKKANLAAFSDAFRYTLLSKAEGWWFDADMMCVRECGRFEELIEARTVRFCAGYEDEQHINGAALYSSDQRISSALSDELLIAGYCFDWGEIGPKLLTRVVEKMGLQSLIVGPKTFYPIHYRNFSRLYDPDWRDWCESQAETALGVHLWNEIRSRLAIPTSLLPPQGSFLHERILSVLPSLRHAPSMQVEMFRRLVRYPQIEAQLNLLTAADTLLEESLLQRLLRRAKRVAFGSS